MATTITANYETNRFDPQIRNRDRVGVIDPFVTVTLDGAYVHIHTREQAEELVGAFTAALLMLGDALDDAAARRVA